MSSIRRQISDKSNNRIWFQVNNLTCLRMPFNNLHRSLWYSLRQIIRWFKCSIRTMKHRWFSSNSRLINSMQLKTKCFHLLERELFLALPTFSYRWWWILKLASSIDKTLVRDLKTVTWWQQIDKIQVTGHKIAASTILLSVIQVKAQYNQLDSDLWFKWTKAKDQLQDNTSLPLLHQNHCLPEWIQSANTSAVNKIKYYRTHLLSV